MADTPGTAWDETDPAGGDQVSAGDNEIKELKTQIREIVDVDHVFESSGQGSTWGYHEVIHFVQQDDDPTAVTDVLTLYQKDVDGLTEIFYRTGAGTVVQLTTGGATYLGSKYTAGTADVTEDGTGVEGTDTAWNTNVSAGDVFWLDGDTRYYSISSVTDADTLVLTEAYEGTTDTEADYHIGKIITDLEHLLPRAGGTLYDVTIATVASLPDDMIDTDQIADDAVTTDQIVDSAVTVDKMASGAGVQMAVGTYTGDGGTTQAITGIGLDLTSGSWWIDIYDSGGSDDHYHKSSDMGTSTITVRPGGSNYGTDVIISGDADGFTIGDTYDVNKSGEVFWFKLFKRI